MWFRLAVVSATEIKLVLGDRGSRVTRSRWSTDHQPIVEHQLRNVARLAGGHLVSGITVSQHLGRLYWPEVCVPSSQESNISDLCPEKCVEMTPPSRLSPYRPPKSTGVIFNETHQPSKPIQLVGHHHTILQR